MFFFFFSSRRRHTRLQGDWSSDVCSSDLNFAFFDDDEHKWRSRVHDIPVLGSPEKLPEEKAKLNIEEAIIAMPSAPAKRVGEIVRLLREARLPCKTVPSLAQLALGQVKVSQLRNVE